MEGVVLVVAIGPAAAGPAQPRSLGPQRLAELGLVVADEGLLQLVHGRDERGQGLCVELLALEAGVGEAVERRDQLGQVGLAQVVVDAHADLLQRGVGALREAAGRAEAADRGGERVGEVARPGDEAEPLHQGVVARVLAHRDLEGLRRGGELHVEQVLEQLELPGALGARPREELLEGGDLAAELVVVDLVDAREDLVVRAVQHLLEDLEAADLVLDAGHDRQELGVDARGEGVGPLAQLPADLRGAEGGVDELVGGADRAGGEHVVEHFGDRRAQSRLLPRVVDELLVVDRGVRDLLHEGVGHRLEVGGLGVDRDADGREAAGQPADQVLLRLGRQRGLVLAEALGGVGVLAVGVGPAEVAAAFGPAGGGRAGGGEPAVAPLGHRDEAPGPLVDGVHPVAHGLRLGRRDELGRRSISHGRVWGGGIKSKREKPPSEGAGDNYRARAGLCSLTIQARAATCRSPRKSR